MKLIGLDYGQRRIGVAVTDETGEFIHSLQTIDRKKNVRCADAVLGVIGREKPSAIVFGLPLDSGNGDTAMSLEVRSFAGLLSQKTPIPVYFVDESLTSRKAQEIIRTRKKKHRRDKKNIDKIAACLILEAFQREKQ